MKLRCAAVACVLMCAACSGDSAGPPDGSNGGGDMGTGGAAGGRGGSTGGNGTGGSGGSGGGTGGTGGTGATGATGGGSGGASGSGGAGGAGGSGGSGGSGTVDARTADTSGPADAPSGGDLVNVRNACPAGPFPAPMVGPPQNVCTEFPFAHSYNEGPTWVASQNAFYFTNFVQRMPTRGDIIKYTPGGACEFFVKEVGCNGLAVTPDGALVAACHQSRSVIRFDLTTGAQTTVAQMYRDSLLDTPNDLVVHDNGTIYFTNPDYELGSRPPGIGPGIFRIDPAGAISAIQMNNRPNGIALSPDQRRLYVIGGGIWDLDPGGVPSNWRSLFTGGDGMAVDCAGNVYSSLGNVFNAQGDQIGSFPRGTNLAFGGADGRTLLVAGGGNSVRIIQMNLPGLP